MRPLQPGRIGHRGSKVYLLLKLLDSPVRYPIIPPGTHSLGHTSVWFVTVPAEERPAEYRGNEPPLVILPRGQPPPPSSVPIPPPHPRSIPVRRFLEAYTHRLAGRPDRDGQPQPSPREAREETGVTLPDGSWSLTPGERLTRNDPMAGERPARRHPAFAPLRQWVPEPCTGMAALPGAPGTAVPGESSPRSGTSASPHPLRRAPCPGQDRSPVLIDREPRPDAVRRGPPRRKAGHEPEQGRQRRRFAPGHRRPPAVAAAAPCEQKTLRP